MIRNTQNVPLYSLFIWRISNVLPFWPCKQSACSSIKNWKVSRYFSTSSVIKQFLHERYSSNRFSECYKSCRKYALVLVESSLLVENRNLMYCKLQQLQAVLQSFLSWQQSGYKALIRIFVKVFENWFLMNCFPIHVIE